MPPRADGTTRRMGLSGYAAKPDSSSTNIAAKTKLAKRDRFCMARSFPRKKNKTLDFKSAIQIRLHDDLT